MFDYCLFDFNITKTDLGESSTILTGLGLFDLIPSHTTDEMEKDITTQ
jgi:hypothetical protein